MKGIVLKDVGMKGNKKLAGFINTTHGTILKVVFVHPLVQLYIVVK